ncbi:MAG TPA: hypothetical protein PLJ98_03175 [Acholeplasmataceae bacterium]|nr:hypothetical protein [Acholeplasmataceae bacterium]
MKKEDIRNTVTYNKLLSYIFIFGVFSFIILLFLIGMITSDYGAAIFMSVFLLVVILTFVIYYIYELRTIMKVAKTFEKCIGRVSTVTNGHYLNTSELVVTFKDFMNEEHRMKSHNMFAIHEIGNYMDKDIIIYYSKEYPKVLIGKLITEESSIDDPYKL